MTTHSARSMPGPRAAPVLGWRGNAIWFSLDTLTHLRQLYQMYGKIVALARGSDRFVLAFGPEHNQQLLSQPDLFYTTDAGSLPMPLPRNSALERLFSNGLLQMNGPRHAQQRRLMMPALHRKRIEAYRDDVVALVERKLASWRTGEQRAILREMRELTLSVAVRTLLGLDPQQEGDAVRRLVEQWGNLFFSIPSMALPFDIPGLPFRRLLHLSQRLESEFQAMIDRKRASGADQGDALSMLLQAHDEDGTQLTDTELIGQTFTLFVAGHETTATALTWTLFLLSQHPRVMADLLDELDGRLRGAAPTVEQLSDLRLLEGVVKESLRLFPSLSWSARVCAAPCELGPYLLPKGASVVYSPFITHRMTELYSHPNRFVPERWQTISPSSYEYLPFAAGPRMCLGAAFAMMEMKIVLPMILQRYRLTLPSGATVDRTGLIFPVPKNELPMQISRQDRQFTRGKVRGNIRALVELEE